MMVTNESLQFGRRRVENMKIMNRKYAFALLVSALFFTVSCTKDTTDQDSKAQEQRFFDIYMNAHYPDAVPQPSGLYYVENKVGTGIMPGDSSWVLVDHVAYKIPYDQVYNTYIENVAIDNNLEDTSAMYGPFKMRNSYLNEGFTEGLKMMREGGEATFLFTSDLGYGSKKTGSVDSYQSLKYEVRLLKVLGDDIEAYNEAQIASYLDTVAVYDTVYDAETDAAIYYIIDKATNGPLVGLDSTLEVTYKGYIMDGRVFDERDESNTAIFKVSATDWAARWDLVLPRLREGEKARMIFPQQLAYGPAGEYTSKGNIKIPPYETLIFDVEILSVEAELDDTGSGNMK
jgi:FKBP-type peptidyl-prolyl cis-trans isomerase